MKDNVSPVRSILLSTMVAVVVSIVVALISALCAAAASGATLPAPAHAAPRAHAHAHASKRATTPAAPKAAPAPGLPRTLDDVHIEGELPVPQVMFITARDARRFDDYPTHRFLAGSARIAGRSGLPQRYAVTPNPHPSTKEMKP